MPIIAMLNTAETTRDPRVRRIAGTLAGRGHEVTVFGFEGEVKTPRERYLDFDLRRLPLPRSLARRALSGLRETAPDAYELAAGLAPPVIEDRRLDFLIARRALSLMRRAYLAARSMASAFASKGDQSSHAAVTFSPIAVIAGVRLMLIRNLALAEAAAQLRPDVIHCNDLDTLLAGVLVKRATGARLVYDAHEIYAEQFAPWVRSDMWHRFYDGWERHWLADTDLRFTVCDSVGEYLASHHEAGRFDVVRNVPSLELLPSEQILERRNEPPRALYHGVYFEYRGLEEMVESARHLESASLVLRGFGPIEPRLRALAQRHRVEDRVEFAAPVSVDQLVPSASACDIGVNPFVSVCENTACALPNKFFEYLMAGLAVANSDLRELRRITRELDVGTLYEPGDPVAMANAIDELAADPDRLSECRHRAYEAARTHLHWESERERLLAPYRAVL